MNRANAVRDVSAVAVTENTARRVVRGENGGIDDVGDDSENERLLELERKQCEIDKAPFRNLSISDSAILDTIEDRTRCEHCSRSRKFFCYTCCVPVIDAAYFPRVKLPIKIDIIKHSREVAGKSTAIHAAILAPEDVKIYIYPDFPEISNQQKTVLIYPGKTRIINVENLFAREEKNADATGTRTVFPIERAILIDSTWQQSREIYKDRRLRALHCVILKPRISQFWRHQKNSPRWYLATIEAIHQFLVELHTHTFGMVESYANLNGSVFNIVQNSVINNRQCSDEHSSEINQKYNGQYDNLLYFFKYMYNKIHSLYKREKLQAYQRPLM